MTRCKRTTQLEVHHILRNGGNGADNATVLCQPCHETTGTYGLEGNSPAPFTQQTKDLALQRAGNQCQCTRNCTGCKLA